jgi:YD repeat-containing protein
VRTVSHTGSTGGYRAALYRFPDQDVAVAMLCNLGSINPGVVAQRVAALALGSALGPPEAGPTAAPIDTARLAALAGVYHSSRTEQVLVLAVVRGALADSTGALAPLIALGPDQFQYRGSRRTLTVLPTGSDGRRRIRSEAPNTRSVEYDAVAPPDAGPDALTGYAGSYRSIELGSPLLLTVVRDTLLVDRGWRPPEKLRPLYRDGFRTGDGEVLRFERDRQGRITGLVLYAGRVRHHHFERVETRRR